MPDMNDVQGELMDMIIADKSPSQITFDSPEPEETSGEDSVEKVTDTSMSVGGEGV